MIIKFLKWDWFNAKKLLYTGLFIILIQLPHITYGNLVSNLNQKLRELEIVLVALAGQIEKPITPEPSPQQKPTEELGKQALVLTNQFRAQNKKPPLLWNQALADLSTEHSQNMASGKVPFSHDGFPDRANRAGFRATAENVYMTSSRKDVAKDAVDAWISSPGHRKNLLGDYSFCGIGAYKNSKGHWYFTQMFGQ